MQKRGYQKLAKIKRGKKIRTTAFGRMRVGKVLSGVKSAVNGWFQIKWDDEPRPSWAHAHWFYTAAQLRKHGLS